MIETAAGGEGVQTADLAAELIISTWSEKVKLLSLGLATGCNRASGVFFATGVDFTGVVTDAAVDRGDGVRRTDSEEVVAVEVDLDGAGVTVRVLS